jgi:hypothetical protein
MLNLHHEHVGCTRRHQGAGQYPELKVVPSTIEFEVMMQAHSAFPSATSRWNTQSFGCGGYFVDGQSHRWPNSILSKVRGGVVGVYRVTTHNKHVLRYAM